MCDQQPKSIAHSNLQISTVAIDLCKFIQTISSFQDTPNHLENSIQRTSFKTQKQNLLHEVPNLSSPMQCSLAKDIG